MSHSPCQRLNPDDTCPELKAAWGQVLELSEKIEKYERGKLKTALGFIESQGLFDLYTIYCEDESL